MPTRATRRLGRGWQNTQEKQLVAIERKQERQNKSTKPKQAPLTKKTLHVPEDAFDTLPVYKGVDVYSNVAFADIVCRIPDILCLENRTEHTLNGSSFEIFEEVCMFGDTDKLIFYTRTPQNMTLFRLLQSTFVASSNEFTQDYDKNQLIGWVCSYRGSFGGGATQDSAVDIAGSMLHFVCGCLKEALLAESSKKDGHFMYLTLQALMQLQGVKVECTEEEFVVMFDELSVASSRS